MAERDCFAAAGKNIEKEKDISVQEKQIPGIRLVATDVDGTLVKDSSNEVYPEIIEAVRKLHEKDILFVVASGRQYYSLVKLFDEVREDMIFIAENGAHIRCRGTDISVVSMEPEIARELILESRRFQDVDVVVSTAAGAYLESKNQEFLDLIAFGYQNKFELVEDILKEDIDIIKVALYHKGSIREIGEKILVPKWKDRCKACMAGEEWVDFMDASVDKGNALKTIQDFFHISREETMVFGDNGNDVGMLKRAEESYVVSNARDDVKRHAKYLCAPYGEKGVYRELQTLF
ncbi:MAG: HAD family hydrolase [Lachnospiraceae bacterium]